MNIPARYEQRELHALDQEKCKQLVEESLKKLPWKEIGYLKDAYDYKTFGSMLTYGERIRIYVGKTEILVISECLFPAQFIDFGKNKKNVKSFFDIFEQAKAN
ncbi:MAG: hypothetical protein H6579_05820 [Chitinophagales bacterium]|nr:hypothetical protein [Bacteroidota bacterium]MCB9256626.1 hypothetical protein [Chitinophagales bacterium]